MIATPSNRYAKRGTQSLRGVYNNSLCSGDRACAAPQPHSRYHGRGVKPQTKSKKLISLIFPSFSVTLLMGMLLLISGNTFQDNRRPFLLQDRPLLPWSWFLSVCFYLPCVHFLSEFFIFLFLSLPSLESLCAFS